MNEMPSTRTWHVERGRTAFGMDQRHYTLTEYARNGRKALHINEPRSNVDHMRSNMHERRYTRTLGFSHERKAFYMDDERFTYDENKKH